VRKFYQCASELLPKNSKSQSNPPLQLDFECTAPSGAQDMDIDDAATWECDCEEIPLACPGAPSKKQQVAQNSSIMAPRRLEEDRLVIAKAKP